jgi:hypothetical protein
MGGQGRRKAARTDGEAPTCRIYPALRATGTPVALSSKTGPV